MHYHDVQKLSLGNITNEYLVVMCFSSTVLVYNICYTKFKVQNVTKAL